MVVLLAVQTEAEVETDKGIVAVKEAHQME